MADDGALMWSSFLPQSLSPRHTGCIDYNQLIKGSKQSSVFTYTFSLWGCFFQFGGIRNQQTDTSQAAQHKRTSLICKSTAGRAGRRFFYTWTFDEMRSSRLWNRNTFSPRNQPLKHSAEPQAHLAWSIQWYCCSFNRSGVFSDSFKNWKSP